MTNTATPIKTLNVRQTVYSLNPPLSQNVWYDPKPGDTCKVTRTSGEEVEAKVVRTEGDWTTVQFTREDGRPGYKTLPWEELEEVTRSIPYVVCSKARGWTGENKPGAFMGAFDRSNTAELLVFPSDAKGDIPQLLEIGGSYCCPGGDSEALGDMGYTIVGSIPAHVPTCETPKRCAHIRKEAAYEGTAILRSLIGSEVVDRAIRDSLCSYCNSNK